MEHIELVVFGPLVAVVGLVLIADVLEPYPILLVLGGLALGFMPGVRELHIELAPELVLVLFLPPLLHSVAFFSSL